MPTIRQKKAFKEVVNGSTLKGAMRKAGYSNETSKRTNKLTKTKGWQELMNKHLPDSLLAKVHKEGLSAGKKIFKNNVTSGEIEEVGVEADYQTRHRYLDSAYKLKGLYAPEKSVTLNVNANIVDPKQRKLAEKYEEELKKGL